MQYDFISFFKQQVSCWTVLLEIRALIVKTGQDKMRSLLKQIISSAQGGRAGGFQEDRAWLLSFRTGFEHTCREAGEGGLLSFRTGLEHMSLEAGGFLLPPQSLYFA